MEEIDSPAFREIPEIDIGVERDVVVTAVFVPSWPYRLSPHVAIELFVHSTAPPYGAAVIADGVHPTGNATESGVVTPVLTLPIRL
jgi:hypothetical protein